MMITINSLAFGAPAAKKPAAPKKKVVVKKKAEIKKKTTKKAVTKPAVVKPVIKKPVVTKPKDTTTGDKTVKNNNGSTDSGNNTVTDSNGTTDTTTDNKNAQENIVQVTIASIDDITDSVIVNTKYTLPTTVKAQLSDNTTADKAIVWDKEAVTDQVGALTFSGKVDGYDKAVKLTLTVNPEPLTITSIDKLATKEIKQDDQYSLPKTVTALMSDGSKKEVEVSWDKDLIPWDTNPDLSHLGLYKFVGTVAGYSKPINFNVLIRGKDLGKPTEATVEAQIGDIVGTKGSIEADAVGKVNYEHFGIYIGNGNVIEFSSTDGTIPSAKITLNPMSKSFKNYFVYKLDTKDIKFTPEEVVKRANQKLGEGGYDLIGNNCEHFAVWCQTGVFKSFQIDSYPVNMIELVDSLIKTVKGLY